MDEIDSRIITMLKDNARMPYVDIAKEVNLTEGAIRARVGKLVKDGTIERFTIDTKQDVRAIVSVATSRSISTTNIANSIRKLGVRHVYEISGNFDIICFVDAPSIDAVNSIIEGIRNIEGVTDTSSSMVLK